MKPRSRLFFPLVVGLFVLIIAAYSPVFGKRITSMGRDVGSQAQGTLTILEQQFNKGESFTEKDSMDMSERNAIPLIDRTEGGESAPVQSSGIQPSVRERVVPPPTLEDPAKKYCTQKGGFIQDRKGVAGVTYAVCLFIDGSECETGQFLNNECHIGQYRVAEDGMKKIEK